MAKYTKTEKFHQSESKNKYRKIFGLSLPEISKLLGRSPQNVSDNVRNGRIEFIKSEIERAKK